jgi:hypothetical protein
MAQHRVELSGTWDDVAGVVTITATSQDFPPLPAFVTRPDLAYEGPHASVTFSVPAKRADLSASPTFIYYERVGGEMQYRRYAWNGTAWVNPVRVNNDGSPYVP